MHGSVVGGGRPEKHRCASALRWRSVFSKGAAAKRQSGALRLRVGCGRHSSAGETPSLCGECEAAASPQQAVDGRQLSVSSAAASKWKFAGGSAEASTVAGRRLPSFSTAALRRCCHVCGTAASSAARQRHSGSSAPLRRRYAGGEVAARTTGSRLESGRADASGQQQSEDRGGAV